MNRGHLNSLEQITIVVFCILVTGLVLPKTAIVLGALYGFTRPLYFYKRTAGFLPGILSIFALFLTSLYSTYFMIGQILDLSSNKAQQGSLH